MNDFILTNWDKIIKLLGLLVLAGMLYARVESRLNSLEQHSVATQTALSDSVGKLTLQLERTNEELIQTRITLAELKIQMSEWKGRQR